MLDGYLVHPVPEFYLEVYIQYVLQKMKIQAITVFSAYIYSCVTSTLDVHHPQSGLHRPPKSVHLARKVCTDVHSVHSVLRATCRWCAPCICASCSNLDGSQASSAYARLSNVGPFASTSSVTQRADFRVLYAVRVGSAIILSILLCFLQVKGLERRKIAQNGQWCVCHCKFDI